MDEVSPKRRHPHQEKMKRRRTMQRKEEKQRYDLHGDGLFQCEGIQVQQCQGLFLGELLVYEWI